MYNPRVRVRSHTQSLAAHSLWSTANFSRAQSRSGYPFYILFNITPPFLQESRVVFTGPRHDPGHDAFEAHNVLTEKHEA